MAEHAAVQGRLVGFVAGYRPPDRPGTLFVWQVAVASDQRGRGVAGTMLDGLVARLLPHSGVRRVETTVTSRNVASDRLFRSFAARWGASVDCRPFLSAGDFPVEAGEHDDEVLYTLGPVQRDVHPPGRSARNPTTADCQEYA